MCNCCVCKSKTNVRGGSNLPARKEILNQVFVYLAIRKEQLDLANKVLKQTLDI